MKLQLALEFMLVFSFVLIVFVFTFALIANQRALLLSGETQTQLQLVAQQLSQQISAAQQAGSGYYAQVPIAGSVGVLSYNITVTKTGIVVASATTGRQIIRAIAYSPAKTILSSPAYLSGNVFVLPITNGSVSIQNSFGTICIDLACPVITATPDSISISAEQAAPQGLNATEEIIAKVTNAVGLPVANALVGFSTSLGAFGTNGVSFSNLTDANGMAVAYLTQNRTSGYALVRVTAFNGDQAAANEVVGWWPLNAGTGAYAAEGSGKSSTGTFNGTASWAKPAYVESLDGISGYISVPSSNALDSNTFTVNLWFNPALYGNGGDGLTVPEPDSYSSMIAGHGFHGMWWFNFSDGDCLNFSINASTTPTVSGCGMVSLNRWYMLTGTYNQSSGALEMFLNGVPVASGTSPGAVNVDRNNLLFSGTNYSQSSAGHFAGKLSDVQVYGSVLNASEVQSLYDTGLSGAPVGGASLAGWWPLDGDTNDYSGMGDNATAFGGASPIELQQNTTLNQSAILTGRFNGTTSGAESQLTQSTSALTLTMWVNASSTTNQALASATGATGLGLFLNGNGQGAVPGTGDEQLGVGSSMYNGYGIGAGSWHFIAVTINNGVGTFYADGSAPYTTTVAAGPYSLASFSLGIPAQGLGAYNGMISDVQLYNASLSQQQISQIYYSGATGVPLPGSGLVLWYPLAGNSKDYSGNGNNGTATALGYSPQYITAPSLLTSAGPYGASFSGYSPDSGNILVQSLPDFTSSGSFSASFWVYKGAYMSSCGSVIAKSSCATSMCIYANTSTTGGCAAGSTQMAPLTLKYTGTSGAEKFSSPPIPAQTWTFATVIFNSGTITWYIDGTPTTSATGFSTPVANAQSLLIGNGFNGTIADVQLYDAPLNPTQVVQLYGAGLPPTASAEVPIGAYP